MAPTNIPSLAPENIRAVVTTKWANGYRPIALTNIESYRVDSQMDQDADTFSISFGDPTNQMRAVLNRNNEIRIQLFGLGKNITYLHTGLVDEVEYDESNILTMTGRDLSAVAADTDAEAGVWRKISATKLIERRAGEIGLTGVGGIKFALSRTNVHPKYSTDGSETEWEFWYRMIREQSQYLWFTPDGFLTSGKLQENQAPTYYFGTPGLKDTGPNRSKWIPVESVSYRKSTQGRLGTVIMWYKKGNVSYHRKEVDPDLNDWIKRPLKYFESDKIKSDAGAKKNLLEELYESKVGALEIRITIPDVGTIVRQNTIAKLNIPELDLDNEWFVVGSTIIADQDGFTQQVRLREKGFAITKRVPNEPKAADPGEPPDAEDCPDLNFIPNHPEWIECFLKSARNKSELAINPDFFAAVLIGICEHETHFHNIRSHNSGDLGRGHPGCVVGKYGPGAHVEYFPLPFTAIGSPQPEITTIQEWYTAFANTCGDHYVDGEYAVGPMQLFTPSTKEEADRIDGPVNEFTGGRWNPCTNIEQASRHLLKNMKDCGVNAPGKEDAIWSAVGAYGYGSCTSDKSKAYGAEIRNGSAKHNTIGVMTPNGWYQQLKDALAGCAEKEKAKIPPNTDFVYPAHIKHAGYPSFPMGSVAGHADSFNNWESKNAVDMGFPDNTPLLAMSDGVISPQASPFSGFSTSVDPRSQTHGMRLHLVCDNNAVFYYQHLNSISVKQNQKVKMGDVVGRSGSGGGAFHLHLGGVFFDDYASPSKWSDFPLEQIIREAAIV